MKIDVELEIKDFGPNHGSVYINDYEIPILVVMNTVDPDAVQVPYYNEDGLGKFYQFNRSRFVISDLVEPSPEDVEEALYHIGVKISGYDEVYFYLEPTTIYLDEGELPESLFEVYSGVVLVTKQDIQEYFGNVDVSDQKVYEEVYKLFKEAREVINGHLVFFEAYANVYGMPAKILETEVLNIRKIEDDEIANRIKERLERMLGDGQMQTL